MIPDPVSPSPNRSARASPVAWTAAALLISISIARWSHFARPAYAGAVLFQLAVMIGLAALAYTGGRSPRRMAGWYALLAYAVWAGLSFLWSDTPVLSAIGSVNVWTGAGWALILALAIRDDDDLRLVLRAVFAAGALAALMGIFLVLKHWSLPSILHVQGHRNFLAIFLLPPILLGMAELTRTRLARSPARTLRWPAGVVAPLTAAMFVALLLCLSWGAMIGLAVGAYCVAAPLLSRRWRIALPAAAVALVALALITLSLPPVMDKFIRSAQSTRWFMWKGALDMIAQRPWMGWGTGAFVLNFADFKPTDPMKFGWLTSITIYPHNELLLVAAETGIAGLLLYLLAHGAALVRLGRAADAADDRAFGSAGWVVLGGLAAMFTHGLVEISLRFWAPAAMYWTLVGVALAFPKILPHSHTPTLPHRRYPLPARVLLTAAASLLALAGALFVIWPGAKSEWLMWRAADLGGTTPGCAELYARAARESRYVPDAIQSQAWSARALAVTGRRDEAIRAYEQVERIAPGFGPVRRMLADLYRQQANAVGPRDPAAGVAELQKSVEMLQRVVRQNPYDADARLDLANDLMRASRRNLSAALEHAQAAVDAAPDNPETHLLLARLLVEGGRLPEALDALQRAQALSKDPAQHQRIAQLITSLRSRLNR